MTGALVIGAGPAGLMAAEVLSGAGHEVVLAEAMPTPGRKLLMAGKSGLNLTFAADLAALTRAVRWGGGAAPAAGAAPPGYLDQGKWGPVEVQDWARGLGVELFTGSSGRVYPVGMKASPLLRAWLRRLAGAGVELRNRWRWRGFAEGLVFDTPEGRAVLRPRVCVLALGGASWPGLGSDAAWVPWLRAAGVEVATFRPANMGLRVDWTPAMARFFGAPLKGVRWRAGGAESRGEAVVTQAGLEGSGVYAIAAAVRDGAEATLDLAPDLDDVALAARLARPRGGASIGNWLRRCLPGDPLKVALLLEWGGRPATAEGWAAAIRALPLRHAGPMGLARAISSAGGITAAALGPGLELRALPGVFAAGEMLDWEAPTGGWLLTECLAQGRIAGRAAAARLSAGRAVPIWPPN